MLLATLALALSSPLTGGNPSHFPIAVWLQSPLNATRYKEIGVNLYVGLWKGPTEEQIAELEKAKMPVVCDMNEWAKGNLGRKIIQGWMHDDEPDNAQALPDGKGYGPPIPPEKIVEGYKRLKAADPTRPVFLNLGQGVAWDDWYGRGVRTRHPEDYPQYVKGTDIASFDIYPVTAEPPVKGNLWYVGHGTRRLREWTTPKQRVWACIEATRISNPNVKPTPAQTKSLVWQAIVHGAQGLVYFSHQFAPSFIEAGILSDEEMSRGVKEINAQIRQLAPVLNGPSLPGELTMTTVGGQVDTLVKRRGKDLYLFAVAMSDKSSEVKFRLGKGQKAEVLGENRTLNANDGTFRDRFDGYGVHLYRILNTGGK